MAPTQTLLDAIDRRDLLDRHIAALVEHWQREHGLVADGIVGPNTIASLQREAETPLTRALHLRALTIALSERGRGEDSAQGNNRGPDVYRYRRGDGTGLPWDSAEPWCAAFVSYCLTKAARELAVPLPFATSRGAKTLTERVAAAGRVCSYPEVGALICWHRSPLGAASRKGHIGIVAAYDLASDTLVTVEGNKNRREHRFATVEEFQYPAGRWRDGLYLIATTAPRLCGPASLRLPLPPPAR